MFVLGLLLVFFVPMDSGQGRVDKATAIGLAACEVFGREDYSRAGIDTIAAEASASTRTI